MGRRPRLHGRSPISSILRELERPQSLTADVSSAGFWESIAAGRHRSIVYPSAPRKPGAFPFRFVCGNVGGMQIGYPVRLCTGFSPDFPLSPLLSLHLGIPPFLPHDRPVTEDDDPRPNAESPQIVEIRIPVKTPELERQAFQRLAADLHPENRNSCPRPAYTEANSGI